MIIVIAGLDPAICTTQLCADHRVKPDDDSVCILSGKQSELPSY